MTLFSLTVNRAYVIVKTYKKGGGDYEEVI